MVGVLVYTDPLDINDGLMSDVNETYPHSWYLPPSGVERGAFATNYGDPLTPYLAAKGNNVKLCCYRLFYAALMTDPLVNLQRKRTEFPQRTSRGSLPFQFSQSDSGTPKR